MRGNLRGRAMTYLSHDRFVLKLQVGSSASEDEVDDDDADDDIEAATAVVADAGSHVIATAADNEQQDYENEYERHAGV